MFDTSEMQSDIQAYCQTYISLFRGVWLYSRYTEAHLEQKAVKVCDKYD